MAEAVITSLQIAGGSQLSQGNSLKETLRLKVESLEFVAQQLILEVESVISDIWTLAV